MFRNTIAASVAGLALVVGCTDTDLDPTHQGSTLPVPDMEKITFAEDALANVVVTGTDGAVQPTTVVKITSRLSGLVSRTASSATGAFVVEVRGATVGDALTVTVADSTGQSEPATFPLVYDGSPPPAPINLGAIRRVAGSSDAVITGNFVSGRDLIVRIAALYNGVVVEGETVRVDVDNLEFEVDVLGVPGADTFYVHGIDPLEPGAPGFFDTVPID